jgi:hypothetical protein
MLPVETSIRFVEEKALSIVASFATVSDAEEYDS